jgi:hypothetical protein
MLYVPKKWPRGRILEEIRIRADAGLSVSSSVIEEQMSGLWDAARREFGTWPRAVALAGIEYPSREWSWKWPRSRILEAIQDRNRKGQSLVNGDVRREVKGLSDAARRGFGNWAKALKAAGVHPGKGANPRNL